MAEDGKVNRGRRGQQAGINLTVYLILLNACAVYNKVNDEAAPVLWCVKVNVCAILPSERLTNSTKVNVKVNSQARRYPALRLIVSIYATMKHCDSISWLKSCHHGAERG